MPKQQRIVVLDSDRNPIAVPTAPTPAGVRVALRRKVATIVENSPDRLVIKLLHALLPEAEENVTMNAHTARTAETFQRYFKLLPDGTEPEVWALNTLRMKLDVLPQPVAGAVSLGHFVIDGQTVSLPILPPNSPPYELTRQVQVKHLAANRDLRTNYMAGAIDLLTRDEARVWFANYAKAKRMPTDKGALDQLMSRPFQQYTAEIDEATRPSGPSVRVTMPDGTVRYRSPADIVRREAQAQRPAESGSDYFSRRAQILPTTPLAAAPAAPAEEYSVHVSGAVSTPRTTAAAAEAPVAFVDVALARLDELDLIARVRDVSGGPATKALMAELKKLKLTPTEVSTLVGVAQSVALKKFFGRLLIDQADAEEASAPYSQSDDLSEPVSSPQRRGGARGGNRSAAGRAGQ
jgi:hypothetical protein